MVKTAGQPIQAMPLIDGKTNLTTGTIKVSELIHCVVTGSVTVTWPSGNTDIIAMGAGQDFGFTGSVEITDGTFHIS